MLRSPMTSPRPGHTVWFGSILALMTVFAAPAADAHSAEGDRLFRQRCAACHSLEADGRGSGPCLAGVVGREAGTLDGARHSQAMQEADLVWDAETLDAFLENPRDSVPGTTMAVRIFNPEQRAAIIAFLQDADTGG